MPVMPVGSHPTPLAAPLSRRDDAVVVLSPCWACGVPGGADWVKVDGVGVLVHNARGRECCLVAVPFVWETGKPLASLSGAVAA
jgi:hypothetical protein